MTRRWRRDGVLRRRKADPPWDLIVAMALLVLGVLLIVLVAGS